MDVAAALAEVKHPALQHHNDQRRGSLQNRVADRITDFAGSMVFVYVHIAWFIVWIAVGVEKFPFGLLTMIVSLEAIFLSTFVMISQNRADAKRQVLADAQWKTVQSEEAQNEQLITLSTQILELTTAIHQMTNEMARFKDGPASSCPGAARSPRAHTERPPIFLEAGGPSSLGRSLLKRPTRLLRLHLNATGTPLGVRLPAIRPGEPAGPFVDGRATTPLRLRTPAPPTRSEGAPGGW